MPDDPPNPQPAPQPAPAPAPPPPRAQADDFDSRLKTALEKAEKDKLDAAEREQIKADIALLKDAHSGKPKKRWWFSPFGD